MSTPETEVKTAVSTEVHSVESRLTALETAAKTWYEKHVTAIAATLAAAVALLAGHLFWR
jgi:hypothetical protein